MGKMKEHFFGGLGLLILQRHICQNILGKHCAFFIIPYVSSLFVFFLCFFCHRVMSKKPATNAMIRTVTAVTMFNAGIKVRSYDT